MKGELEFTRLLRVDGRFEGELITDKGSLVVGPKGEVVGDLKNMQVVPWYRRVELSWHRDTRRPLVAMQFFFCMSTGKHSTMSD